MTTIRETRDPEEMTRWRGEVIAHVFGAPPSEALMRANEDYYRRNMGAGHYALIAGVDGEDAGCGALCFSEELPSPDNPSGKCAYLMNIYVREAFREHGLGHEIVRSLIEEARRRGCGKIYLETTPDGRPVYSSMGFEEMKDMMKLTYPYDAKI